MAEFKLASEFPPARREDWLALVEKALKGAPLGRLVSTTYDGLSVEPLYERAAGASPVAGRAAGAPWQIVQRVDHPDPAAANAEALHDLENGAAGLTLVLAGAVGAYGYGLAGADAIARALDGVHLDAGIAVDLDAGPRWREAADRVAALAKSRGLQPSAADVRFGIDPLGAAVAGGWTHAAWPVAAMAFAETVADLSAQGFRGPFAAADSRVIHNAGGSEAQELAFALAAAVAYLRALEANKIAPERARRMIFFRLSADSEQFLTLAKFRALRKLWARVEEASGLDPKPAVVAAETAWRMTTRRDPHVNLLRTTAAAFAAGLGGADSVTVLPFTLALGLPDRFARRIARNTQLILMEEASLAKVADPAAGSGGIEDLTEKLCRAAWSLFQEIERAGGAWAALELGLIQKKVAAVRAERVRAVADGRDALTGTTIFSNPAEMPVAVLETPRPSLPKPPATAIRIEALAPMRLGEPYE